MKFIPNTLLARFLILIATVLIIAQIVSIRIFDYFERGPRAEAVAQEIETVVNFTRASLISSREDKRLELLSELSTKGDIRIYPAYYFEDIEPLAPDPFLQVVVGKLKERLGENTIVITYPSGATAWVQRWPASLVSAPLGRCVAPACWFPCGAPPPLGVQDGGTRNLDLPSPHHGP